MKQKIDQERYHTCERRLLKDRKGQKFTLFLKNFST